MRKSLLSLAAIGIAAAGCSHPVQDTAAHKIANVLPTVLGPAAHYEVQVDGDPFALARGRARAVRIEGLEVQIAPDTTLDTLNINARDVSFSRETRRLEEIGKTDFTATIGQQNLTNYLAQSKPLLPGLLVTLRESDIEAVVPVTFLGLKTTAALSGTLAPDATENGKLDLISDGARFGIVPLPSGLVNLALDQLNPLVDLSHVRVPLTVTQASVTNSRLTLQGTADLNGLVRE